MLDCFAATTGRTEGLTTKRGIVGILTFIVILSIVSLIIFLITRKHK